jgi:hypothetical protein
MINYLSFDHPNLYYQLYFIEFPEFSIHYFLTNLQSKLGYSLYNEIEKVNPELKRELINAQ